MGDICFPERPGTDCRGTVTFRSAPDTYGFGRKSSRNTSLPVSNRILSDGQNGDDKCPGYIYCSHHNPYFRILLNSVFLLTCKDLAVSVRL
jgi:hypothetical protein